LIKAGAILLMTDNFPFPILPPPGGWDPQIIPFMLGLGMTDLAGILLGLCFVYRALIKGAFYRRLGVISLTIFIAGSIVFAFGTLPSGAWEAHPIAYGSMAFLFAPTVLLFIWLLRSNITRKPVQK
jgi:hypothetical protein